MVGNGAVSVPNLARVELGDDEMLVLCSDGVHKHMDARDISRLLRRGNLPLARRCTRLLALARAHGSSDDATVLVIHREAVAPRSPAAWF
jgi:protein phosphatase